MTKTSIHTNGEGTRAPLQLSGALDDKYNSFPVTPTIGTEFPATSVRDLLTAKNSDDLLRDLAITVSRRGVVFFRNQDISIAEQKQLAQRLGELSGKPASSKLHIHPLHNSEREHGAPDDEVSVISSEEARKYLQSLQARYGLNRKKSLAPQWHTDTSFEPVPSDYAILHLHTIPPVGGDTLWASTYDIYDRLGERYAEFLEGLTGHYRVDAFHEAAKKNGFNLYQGERGSPKNTNVDVLAADHPLVRTNPVTGWKAVYAHTVKSIYGLTDDETKNLKQYLLQLVLENHDTVVRFRWGAKDLAIWDNRSTLHAATPDFDPVKHDRTGNRVVSVGEEPYLDPKSTGRYAALHAENGGDAQVYE